jgi:hypothetical protein
MAKEIKFEDVVVDGKNVRILRQGLRARIRAKAVIIGIAGPALARGLVPLLSQGSGEDGKFDLGNISLENSNFENILIPAIDGLSGALSEDKLLKLIDTLMVGVSVDEVDVSDPDKFDFVFDSCMGTMYKVCFASAKYNFADLISDLSTLVGSQKDEEKEQKEPNDSGSL